jgi:hypothetical protein
MAALRARPGFTLARGRAYSWLPVVGAYWDFGRTVGFRQCRRFKPRAVRLRGGRITRPYTRIAHLAMQRARKPAARRWRPGRFA